MNDERKAFILTALQDPEVRRNVAWTARWLAERIRAIVTPDDDEPPAPEVSAVLAEAKRITREGHVRSEES